MNVAKWLLLALLALPLAELAVFITVATAIGFSYALTRPNVSVTVVTAPTMSNSPVRRASCNAQALSLPLDQAISAFARVAIRA